MKKLIFALLILITGACSEDEITKHKSYLGYWNISSQYVKGEFTIADCGTLCVEDAEFSLDGVLIPVSITDLILDSDSEPGRLILSDAAGDNSIDISFGINKTFEKLDGQATILESGTPKSGYVDLKIRR